MIEVRLQLGSNFLQQPEARPSAYPLRDRQRDDAQSELRIWLVGCNSEAGAERGLEAGRIGIDHGDNPAADGKAIAVTCDRCAVGSDQFLQPQLAKLEKALGPGLGNGFGEAADRVQCRVDRLLNSRLAEDVLQHRSGDWNI